MRETTVGGGASQGGSAAVVRMTSGARRYYPGDVEMAILFAALVEGQPGPRVALETSEAVERWRGLRGGRADDTSVLASCNGHLLAEALGLGPSARAPLQRAVVLAAQLADHAVWCAVDVCSEMAGGVLDAAADPATDRDLLDLVAGLVGLGRR